MAKKICWVLFTVFIFLFLFVSGCRNNPPSSPKHYPTATATPTAMVYVHGTYYQSQNSDILTVNLNENNASGSGISGAAITINGNMAAGSTPGIYLGGVPGGISAGSAVTISINTVQGTIVTGTITMPQGAAITAPLNGATISHASDLQVDWTGPGDDGTDLVFYMAEPSAPWYAFFISYPGSGYLNAAGTLAANTYKMCVIAHKTMPLSNAAPASDFSILSTANEISLTVN